MVESPALCLLTCATNCCDAAAAGGGGSLVALPPDLNSNLTDSTAQTMQTAGRVARLSHSPGMAVIALSADRITADGLIHDPHTQCGRCCAFLLPLVSCRVYPWSFALVGLGQDPARWREALVLPLWSSIVNLNGCIGHHCAVDWGSTVQVNGVAQLVAELRKVYKYSHNTIKMVNIVVLTYITFSEDY